MFNLMVFLFFFFLGLLALLWQMQKQNNLHFKEISEENAQLRILLRALESRLISLDQNATTANKNNANSSEAGEEYSVSDPLLHLSFENHDDQPLPNDPALDLHFDEQRDS